MPESSDVLAAARDREKEVRRFLFDLISLPSVHGEEAAAQGRARDAFRSLGYEVREDPIEEGIREDPEYSDPGRRISYEGRPNLIVSAGGSERGKDLILNTHMDVVPAGGWHEAFQPAYVEGDVVGRGAVDCKGQVATLYLLLLLLKEFDVSLGGGLEAQVVIEEEVGGNGTLSLIRGGRRAAGAIVMEATGLSVCPANRGALWFRAVVEGRSIHMARKFEGISAIDKSMELIGLLYDYEKRLTEQSRGQPLFSEYEHPVQVNVGRMEAGDWPATVPALSILEGGVGFLPNRDLETVKRELKELPKGGDPWLAAHTRFDFSRLHNDAYEIPVEHPLVTGLVNSCRNSRIKPRVRGMIASCDARLFNKLAGMPVVVFGPGGIEQAHARGERISMEEVLKAASVLFDFVLRWCGPRGESQRT